MSERLKCCVPFCKRTTSRAEFSEWICGDHWKLIDKDRRRAYGRKMRRWRRYFPTEWTPALARMWRSLKRQATERAMGIR